MIGTYIVLVELAKSRFYATHTPRAWGLRRQSS